MRLCNALNTLLGEETESALLASMGIFLFERPIMTNPWMIMILRTYNGLCIAIHHDFFSASFFRASLQSQSEENMNTSHHCRRWSKLQKQAQPASSQVVEEDDALIAVLAAAVAEASGSKLGSFAITQVHQSPIRERQRLQHPNMG